MTGDAAIEANMELLIDSIRRLVPGDKGLKRRWDDPKSSYDPLLRESKVLDVVVEHFASLDLITDIITDEVL